MRAIISGGATGGHIYPALAVVRELAGRGESPPEVLWLGGGGQREEELVSQAGLPYRATNFLVGPDQPLKVKLVEPFHPGSGSNARSPLSIWAWVTVSPALTAVPLSLSVPLAGSESSR